MNDNIALTRNRNDVTKDRPVVLSGTFNNGVGETLYRVYDQQDGSSVLALGFCGAANSSEELMQQNNFTNFNDPFEMAKLQSAQAAGTVDRILPISTATPSMQFLETGRVSPDPWQRVKDAYHLYHGYGSGIVRTWVDFMTDISVDGLRCSPNRKYKNWKKYLEFYESLFMKVEKNNNRLASQTQNIFLDLFCCNNAYVWVSLAPYTNKYFENLKEIKMTPEKKRDLIKAAGGYIPVTASLNHADGDLISVQDKTTGKYLDVFALEEYAARKNRWSNKQLPNVITTLCPANTEIRGGGITGLKEYHIMIDPATVKAIKENPDLVAKYVNPEILAKLNSNNTALVFRDDQLTHLKMKTPDYMPGGYGEPKTLAALEPISRRRRRVLSDEQAASRLVRQIILVRIGNDKLVATPEQIRAAASLFRGLGPTGTIFWNHTMDIETVAPQDIAELLKQENYSQVENEIYESLEFPMFLSGRETKTSFSMASFLVRPMVHFIQAGRRTVMEEFLEPLFRNVALSMDFPEDAVTPKFNTNILEDYDQLAKRLVSYTQNKVTSVQSVVERLPDDMNWDEEKPRLEEEHKDLEKGMYGAFKPTGQAGRPGAGRPGGDPSPSSAPKSKLSPKGTGNKPKQKQTTKAEEDQRFVFLDLAMERIQEIKDLANEE